MSGLYIPNIQVPQATPIDVAGAMQRGQQYRGNALAMLAQQRRLEQDQQQQDAYRMYGGGLAAQDPTKRQNALRAILEAAPGTAQQIIPMIRDEREGAEFAALLGGGAPAAAPQAPAPAAPGMATPAVQQEPLAAIARAESGGNDAARNPNSTAAGRFQITDGTWAQYAPRLGLPDAARMAPGAQLRVAQAIQEDGARALGRPLQGWEQYGAHLLGVGGMRAFAQADPNANAQEVYAQAAGPQIAAAAFRQNPGLLEPNMTVGQVQQAIAQRAGGGAPQPAATPVSAPGPSTGLPTPERMQAIAAMAANGNQRAMRYLQAIQPMLTREMRLTPIRLPDGSEVQVPTNQAAGMVSAPQRDASERLLDRWRELDALGDSATPSQVRERDILDRRLRGSGVAVNVDTRAETAEATGRGRSLAEEGERVRVGAETAAATIDTIRQIRALGPNTDRLAPAREVLGGYLEALGIPAASSRLVREATTLQAFNAAATNVILGRQMEQRGVQTDGDAQRMRETFARITNTNEANDLIMRATEAQAMRAMERADFYRDWRQGQGENGRARGTLDGAGEAWARHIRETPLVARLPDGRVTFFNEFLANAMQGGQGREPLSREAAIDLWRQNATQRPAPR